MYKKYLNYLEEKFELLKHSMIVHDLSIYHKII